MRYNSTNKILKIIELQRYKELKINVIYLNNYNYIIRLLLKVKGFANFYITVKVQKEITLILGYSIIQT